MVTIVLPKIPQLLVVVAGGLEDLKRFVNITHSINIRPHILGASVDIPSPSPSQGDIHPLANAAWKSSYAPTNSRSSMLYFRDGQLRSWRV